MRTRRLDIGPRLPNSPSALKSDQVWFAKEPPLNCKDSLPRALERMVHPAFGARGTADMIFDTYLSIDFRMHSFPGLLPAREDRAKLPEPAPAEPVSRRPAAFRAVEFDDELERLSLNR